MLNTTIGVESWQQHLEKQGAKKEKQSLKRHLLETLREWVNGLLEGSGTSFWGGLGVKGWMRSTTTIAMAVDRAG